MFRRLAVIAAALACCAIPAPTAVAAAETSQMSPVPFGFNENLVSNFRLAADDAARLNSQAGGTLHRIFFDWRWAERYPNDWRLGIYDQQYEADLARGVKPIFVLGFAPQWTWAEGTPCQQWGQDCRYPVGPQHMEAHRNIARVLATRYPQAAAIEVWNEPNLKLYWQSGVDPAYYARLVMEANAAVKAAGSSIPVLGGALSNYAGPNSTDAMTPRAFLRNMYRAGVKGHMDALSVHPYASDIDLWRFYKTLTEVREVRDAAGDADTPLFISELGFTTSGELPALLSENDQGAQAVRVLGLLRRMPDVSGIVFHTLVEPTQWGMTTPQRGYGVVRSDLTPKPAYCAIADANGSGYACPDTVTQSVPSKQLVRRWDAQDLVQRAMDAARVHRARTGGYSGLDSAALNAIDPAISPIAAPGSAMPGASADPSRMGVWVSGTGAAEELLICNASNADRSYCIYTRFGSFWAYGKATGSIFAAAGAVTTGTSRTW